jgi:outer membrane protein assembly factor BamE
MRKAFILGVLATTLLGAGCSSDQVPFVYRIDIPQGNVVTQEMLNRLEPGMSKQQVSLVMGTPLVVDPFHPDQWVYLYRLRKGGEAVEERRIELQFQNDRLQRVTGDVKPAAGAPAPAPAPAAAVTVPLEPPREPGLWERIKRSVGLGEE